MLHDAIYEAAAALSSQPAERRKIISIISDGSANGAPMHPFNETLNLLLKNEIQVFGVLRSSEPAKAPIRAQKLMRSCPCSSRVRVDFELMTQSWRC